MASQSSTNMPGSPKICNMYVASDPEDTDVLSEVVEDESMWTDATPNAENQVEDISVEFCDDDPTIGRHLSESDICPKAELGISDRCRCRTGVVFGDICPNFGSYCNLGSHSHFTSSQVIS